MALAATTGVWIAFVGPAYDRAITAVSLGLLHRLESPRLTGEAREQGVITAVTHVGPVAQLDDQRLELRTHHNNTPLLVALLLATPGLVWRRRLGVLGLGIAVLAVTHVLYFALVVHWAYALHNVGPYHVEGLQYWNATFWESLDSGPETAKRLLFAAFTFATSIGRRIVPILIWAVLCWRTVVPGSPAKS